MRTAIILEQKDLDLSLLVNNNIIFHRGPAGQRINGIYWNLWYKPEEEEAYFNALKFAKSWTERKYPELELTKDNAQLVKDAIYAMKYAVNALYRYQGKPHMFQPKTK